MNPFKKHLLFLLILLYCMGLGVSELHAAPTKIWGEEWLDLVDEPAQTVGTLVLPKVADAGPVDITNYAGKIIVLLEIDPDRGWWETNLVLEGTAVSRPTPDALDRYQELTDIYTGNTDVVFIPIWTGDAGEAADYLAKYTVPGEDMLLDASNDLLSYIGMNYTDKERIDRIKDTYDVAPFNTASCIIHTNGEIVYRDARYFPAHALRTIIDRLTDTNFDANIRMDFPNTRSQWEYTTQGSSLVYTEDFEQYSNSYSFKLDPRWGFSYDYQGEMDNRSDIHTQGGVGSSKALYVNANWYWMHHKNVGYMEGDGVWYNAPALTLPAPLTNGTLTFYIKNGPEDPLGSFRSLVASKWDSMEKLTGIRLYTSHYDLIGSHSGGGTPLPHEIFVGRLWNENGVVTSGVGNGSTNAVFSNSWHKVEIKCVPGQDARFYWDDEPLDELDSSSITTIEFSPVFDRPGYYIDDLSITYSNRTVHSTNL